MITSRHKTIAVLIAAVLISGVGLALPVHVAVAHDCDDAPWNGDFCAVCSAIASGGDCCDVSEIPDTGVDYDRYPLPDIELPVGSIASSPEAPRGPPTPLD